MIGVRVSRTAVAEVVAHEFGVTFDEMQSMDRSRLLCRARAVAWMFIRELRPETSYSELGRIFTRDHTTILHGFKKLPGYLREEYVSECTGRSRAAISNFLASNPVAISVGRPGPVFRARMPTVNSELVRVPMNEAAE